jgi:hypothetical protein
LIHISGLPLNKMEHTEKVVVVVMWPFLKLKQLICIAFLTAINAKEKQMSSELKSRIAWVLVFSFFAFQAGIYCQRRVDQWHADQRIRYERAAAQYEAQHPSNPKPVLLDGVWSCEPPSKMACPARWRIKRHCLRCESPDWSNPMNHPFLLGLANRASTESSVALDTFDTRKGREFESPAFEVAQLPYCLNRHITTHTPSRKQP